jgi:hypothetical protein
VLPTHTGKRPCGRLAPTPRGSISEKALPRRGSILAYSARLGVRSGEFGPSQGGISHPNGKPPVVVVTATRGSKHHQHVSRWLSACASIPSSSLPVRSVPSWPPNRERLGSWCDHALREAGCGWSSSGSGVVHAVMSAHPSCEGRDPSYRQSVRLRVGREGLTISWRTQIRADSRRPHLMEHPSEGPRLDVGAAGRVR